MGGLHPDSHDKAHTMPMSCFPTRMAPDGTEVRRLAEFAGVAVIR